LRQIQKKQKLNKEYSIALSPAIADADAKTKVSGRFKGTKDQAAHQCEP